MGFGGPTMRRSGAIANSSWVAEFVFVFVRRSCMMEYRVAESDLSSAADAMVKVPKTALALVTALVVTVAGEPVLAHGHGGRSGSHRSGSAHSGARHSSSTPHFSGHHFRSSHVAVGVIAGAPFFWYYAPPDYPLGVAIPSLPIYIEQADQQAYWYYCSETLTYYPYVEQCPGGWQLVVPQAPPG
jgi:hypothetical protein